MLKKLHLHNFRTYLNAEADFKSRHLIIGKNNSGKTNLVTAIRFLGACAVTDLQTATSWLPGGLFEMRNWTSNEDKTELACECVLDFNGDLCEFTYELTLKLVSATGSKGAGQFELAVARERLSLRSGLIPQTVLIENDGREAKLLHEEQMVRGQAAYQPKTLAPAGATMLSKLYELETNRRAIRFRQFLGNWVLYTLNPESIRRGWHGRTEVTLTLDNFGANLANVLFQLKSRDEMRYRRLLERARIVEPALGALNFQPTPDQGIVPFVQLAYRPSATWIGLSDGTLRMLALSYLAEIVAMYPSESWPVPAVLIIEEPENGIAPSHLAKLFLALEESLPHGQFIFTSHSPYFIDQFDASRECVTLLKRKNGRTEICSPPPTVTENEGPDRLTLAQQYASELLD